MRQKIYRYHHLQPAFVAVIAFILLLAATISYTNYKQGLWEKDIRANLTDVLIGRKSKLEKALYSRIYYTRGVAAFVALKPDITNPEYYQLAKEYIKTDSVIGTMALSKNCVINAIYPLAGHEAAIGLNLLKHPERKEIVEKTIQTHQTFVAGPVELVEGGIAFISYTPIFDNTHPAKEVFWGMTDIVIKQQALFNEARFKTPENGFDFALRGYNGTGNDGAVFWGNPVVFEKNPVAIPIDLPIGTWTLAAAPIDGWNQYPDQDKAISFILFFSSFIISVLVWLFSRALLKIRRGERELKAIFGTMDNIIVEYNANGEYLKIAPTNDPLLMLDRNELLGKTLHEVFDKDKADYLLSAIRECLLTQKLVVIEYSLEIKGEKHWFSARINYKAGNTVIFNAFDITGRKMNEETILESEIHLRELNAMKDKFFSIIAHDLRNPVGTMKTLTDIILNDFDGIDNKEKKELLQNIQSSSTNLHLLLEDLLQWSRSQSGNIQVKKQDISLNNLCRNLINHLSSLAHLKEITLINETNEYNIYCDPDLTGIVLRNLVSNAIKFTQRGGTIKICSELLIQEQGRWVKIDIIDNGVGMNEETMQTIFRIDKTVSLPGTENEPGTGLGLLLCKELVEKQGGQLSVRSSVGGGSVFSFSLPINN